MSEVKTEIKKNIAYLHSRLLLAEKAILGDENERKKYIKKFKIQTGKRRG